MGQPKNKYCRICWNTKNWQTPSKDAKLLETSGTYVSRHGFGHEEWLFNFKWLYPDFRKTTPASYRYGYLQPIGKYRNLFEGKTFSVLLYTISPEKNVLLIASIRDIYVPQEDEILWAYKLFLSNGWLSEMRDEIDALNLDSSHLEVYKPSSLINIRFRPSDVFFFDPRLLVSRQHKICKSFRYHPFDWDDEFPELEPTDISPPDNPENDSDPSRSETKRIRSMLEETSYDPRHTQLQNRLYRYLCKLHGRQNVAYESKFVDLSFKEGVALTYIEIKMDNSVKKCIRNALGQLLEYAHYPNTRRAKKLLVVGDAVPTPDDHKYMSHIRFLYKIPIHYVNWNWQEGMLKEVI